MQGHIDTRSGGNRPITWLVAAGAIATAARVWLGPTEHMPSVQAQIPDAGSQRLQLVEEMRRTNDLLREIREILKTEPLQVVVRSADNQSEARPGAP